MNSSFKVEFTSWFVANHVGDWASVFGVLIAIVGFVITIRNVARSRKSADRAETAATKAAESIRHIDAVQNLSRAVSTIEEIQRLNRAKEWKVLLDRHLSFRSILIEVKGAASNLASNQKAIIQAGIVHSTRISNKIEVALSKNSDPENIPLMNRVLSKQMEKLQAILVEIRTNTDG